MKLPRNISESLELKFSALARKMDKKNQISYSLGLGEPYHTTPDFIIEEAYKAMKKRFNKILKSCRGFCFEKKICENLNLKIT